MAVDAVSLLDRYRRERGLTQEALAGELGVTPSMVSSWLTRQRGLSLATALRIEKRTGGAVPAVSWRRPSRRSRRAVRAA